MKVKVEILSDTLGGGQPLKAGNVYEVNAVVATGLIQARKGRIVGPSLIKVKLLQDDILQGLRRGTVAELPAPGADKLIQEYRAEVVCDESDISDKDKDAVKVKILITQNTYSEVNGKITLVEAGQIYYLKSPHAAGLICAGKAKFPDSVTTVGVKLLYPVALKGGYFRANDIANLPVSDAEELIRRWVAEPISIEESEESQGTEEGVEKKKSFIDKVLGR
jgi:hypothetical protein